MGAGAFRSAILAIWIAVTSDLIDKIRLLAEQGEPAAAASAKELETAIASSDKVALQRFENGLLDTARDQLHFLGNREYDELSRLKADRNLCAHPAYVGGDDELFNPGPELVRAHLAAAVDGLLAHGPVAGRKAIERFIREISQPSFPRSDSKLAEYLKDSYLDRGSATLRSNLMKAVCKATLAADVSPTIRWRCARTAMAMFSLARAELEQAARQLLNDRQDNLDDAGLMRLVTGLCYLPFTWDALRLGTRNRIEQLMREVEVTELLDTYELFGPLPAAPIDGMLIERLFDVVTEVGKKRRVVELYRPEPRLLPKLEELLEVHATYIFAGGVLRWINAIAEILSAADVERILEIAASNTQVYQSVLANEQLAILRELTIERLGIADQWRAYDARIALMLGIDPPAADQQPSNAGS
ncbi:hypothetical protein [Paractinoplanes atraurantiacus]|uniref:Uncharacterized protein n=1 Tax=Paractinoplanes atraurantiacus TaxID=1036182 RepID=A0A285K4P1_9ACTN|nr:hypothetical protein [Actinoplanes atraurantiacus]SNY66977.1 hypothetical protein SAMN05421748_1317 [Actinoplanes atraurantiacus]